MNKKNFLPLSILAAVLVGLAVTSRFWLFPIVDHHVRASLESFSETSSQISISYDQNALAIDAFSRTLHLENVELLSHLPEHPAKIKIRSLDIQIPVSMLLLLLGEKDSTENTLALPLMDMQGVSIALSFGTVNCQQLALENISVDLSNSSVLLSGDVTGDVVALLDSMRVEKLSANALTFFDVTQNTHGSSTNLTINNWNGRNIGNLTLTSLIIAEKTNDTRLSAEKVAIDNLHWPVASEPEALSLQMHDGDFLDQDIPSLLMFTDKVDFHVFDKTVLQKVALTTQQGELLLKHLALDWSFANPQNISLQLQGLSLPTELFRSYLQNAGYVFITANELERALSGLDLIRLDADLTTKQPDQSRAIVQEKIDIDVADLGRLSYSHKVDHTNADVTLGDIMLNYTDNSLLARLSLLVFPLGQAEHQILAFLDSFTSSANTPLIDALKTFVRTPGSITLTSLPDKTCSQGNLFLVLANPTHFFQIDVVPGKTSMKQQTATLLLPQ